MSQFSEEFEKVLRRAGLKKIDVSRMTGMSSGLLTQYARGSTKMSPDALLRILTALPKRFWPDLVAAHLNDETPEPAKWSVEITKRPEPESEDTSCIVAEEPPETESRSDFERAIDSIRSLGIHRPEIREAVLSLEKAWTRKG